MENKPALGPASLGGKLVLWILLVHLVAAVGVIWYSYENVGGIIAASKDDQLQTLSESYAAAANIGAGVRPINLQAVRQNGAYVVQYFSDDGRLLASSFREVDIPLQQKAGLASISTLTTGQTMEWRTFTAFGLGGSSTIRVQVSQSLAYQSELVARRALGAARPIAFLLPLTLAVLLLVIWRASRALRRFAADVAAQDENRLTELPITSVPSEIAPLVLSFNSLLARLKAAFASQRSFVQDAAHELRTPIAVLGIQAENLQSQLVKTPEALEQYEQLEAGIARAQRLIDQLLRLSKQEGGNTETDHPVEVDVESAVRESIGHLMPIADARRIDIGLDEASSFQVVCNPADLRSIFDNLIDNALRHAPEASSVDIHLRRDGQAPVVDVVNAGPGIPPEYLTRVFDRFYRVPGTAAVGSGLGLAIAQTCAARMGATVELLDRTPVDGASGVVARVRFGVTGRHLSPTLVK